MTYTLKDTPCGEMVEKKICCFSKGVHRLFPEYVVLQEMKAESYVGTILWGSKGQAIGLIEVIGRQPLANRRLAESMLQLVAVRAAGELERKQVEEELRENQSRLDLAIRSAQMGVWRLDLIENRRHFDDQVCRLLGIAPTEFTGTAEEFYKALHPDDRETVKAAWARTIEQDVPYETEYRAGWPDGSVHYLSARGKMVHDDKGRPVRINGLIWDITERKRMQEELRKSRDELELRVRERTAELHQAGERLRSLASELLNSGENERKLIAQEIHDGLSSQLAAIKFCMERELCAEREGQSGESIRRSCAMIQNAMEETRRIMANLRPSILDDLGILPTITWLCREFQEMNPSIDPVIKFEISEEDIPAGIKTVMFRLLQEALNNIRKYSRAGRVEISLRTIGSSIVFLIKDNGRGFNPEKVLSGKKIGHGFGLRGMLERVELSGGKCDVKSAPGKGVSISAEWNIKS
jgi:PAS domain S-box-containing protein